MYAMVVKPEEEEHGPLGMDHSLEQAEKGWP